MLVNKSTSNNKHKLIARNSVYRRQILQPPISLVTLLSVCSSYSTGGATATLPGSSHHRHAAQHHDNIGQRLWRHYVCWNTKRTCALRRSSWWHMSSIVVILGVIVLPLAPNCEAVGYSYTRFRGPVVGPENRIYHRVGNTGEHVLTESDDPSAYLDYVAKPEYEFAYGVEDAQAHILHNRNEMRDGDAVKGVYSVVDPDGTLRVVKYTADDVYGFQAEVIMNGISTIHGQLQPDTPTTITNLLTKHQNSDHNSNDGLNLSNAYQSLNKQYENHPFYQYPTPAASTRPPTASNTENYKESGYDGGQTLRYKEDEYQPHYEVHEKSSGENKDEHGPNVSNEDEQNRVQKEKDESKKKEYEDNDEEEEEYDDSDELIDYDEGAMINNHPGGESDEYY